MYPAPRGAAGGCGDRQLHMKKRVLVPPVLWARRPHRMPGKVGAPFGNRNAFRHGRFTRERRALYAEVREHIRRGRAMVAEITAHLAARRLQDQLGDVCRVQVQRQMVRPRHDGRRPRREALPAARRRPAFRRSIGARRFRAPWRDRGPPKPRDAHVISGNSLHRNWFRTAERRQTRRTAFGCRTGAQIEIFRVAMRGAK
jgi:hypothetical protein